MAEVLITLGIIGVVAAMTIPTLIHNYNKKQTAVKLKQTYSIISQALKMAQAEHGDTTTWEVGGIYGTPTDDPNFDHEETVTKFATKYFIPYLKVAKDYGYTSYSEIGYDGHYVPVSGNLANSHHSPGYIISLSSDVLVKIGLGTAKVCIGGTNPDGSCVAVDTWRNIIFKVDINGFEKPNTNGIDLFNFMFDIPNKKFSSYNYGNSSRQQVLNNCKTDDGSQICGQLIFMDGWEIKDDYPWY